MKLRKVRLKQGTEIPFNEAELSSKHYDLDYSPESGLLRMRPKVCAPTVDDYYITRESIVGFHREPEANGPRKPGA